MTNVITSRETDRQRSSPHTNVDGKAGLAEALASEWTKFRSLRSTVWTLVTMGLLVPAMSLFVGLTKSLQPDDTILGGSLTGAPLGQIAAAILGVLVMTSEYGNGMIRVTFAACPRRATVLAAKASVTVVMVFVVSLVSCILAHRIGELMLSSGDYARGEPLPALLGVALNFSALGALGLAVGTILRRSAGAITAVISLILLPSLVGPLFGDWQRWVGGASPTAALEKMTQTSDAAPELVGTLGAWPSLAIVCVYTGLALLAAATRLKSRDA